jgi:hypothetical protein
MSESPDYFADLLLPGEPVEATIAGPGLVAGGDNPERVWIQLAVTPFRMVGVKLVQTAGSGAYKPALRQVVQKDVVRVRRFPRSPTGPARLELWGFQKDPLVLADIDDGMLYPSLEPFLATWGGVVDETGDITFTRTRDPNDTSRSARVKPLYLALGGLGLALFCGCLSSVLAGIYYYLHPTP